MTTTQTYQVTVIVKEKNYRETFTVQAESKGLAETRATNQAFKDGLHLNGQMVEYEVK